ncbi:MAG: hypothetical protein Q8L37_07195 [Candidatus Gottesmanbacteria bacterium]|nr:hypothetical protein [Candidatus Gottesmanbacteria bacterium]
MANLWDTLSQQVATKIQNTASKLFGQAQSFIQQNPTPASWVQKQLQPQVQPFVNRVNDAVTNFSNQLKQNTISQQSLQKQGIYSSNIIPSRAVMTDYQPQIDAQLNKLPTLKWGVGNPIKPEGFDVKTGDIAKFSLNLLTGGSYSPEEQSFLTKANRGQTTFTPKEIAAGKQLQETDRLAIMGFTKTPEIQNALSGRLSLTKTPEEASIVYNEFADKLIKTGAKDDLQALRATLNKELVNLVGGSGDYKKDYAIIQTMKNDTQVGSIIRTIEDKIFTIDEALSKVPKTPNERLSNLLNYPQELGSRGFTARQIRFIDAKEAQRILDDGISPLDHSSYDKMVAANVEEAKRYVKKAFTANDPQAIGRVQNVIDPTFTNVQNKVNIVDYLRTPEQVLQKIGLGDEAKYLRSQYESYLTQLPDEIKRISDWQKRVPPESNERIFRALDGENVGLNPVEGRVAMEIRGYLADWATKLKLPPSKQISNYITHIWTKGAVEGEFDPALAKLIDQKVAGGVYDPFLLMRKSDRIDYLKDTWAALDAYTKRAVRKYNLDPALEALKAKSPSLELSQYKYLQKLTDRINLRPTEIDTLIDNFIKSTPIGYRFGPRPVTALSQSIRQTVYRGTLGLNVSSALRNLSQGANTYAELGERWTATGYLKLARNWGSNELERVGVLKDSFIQDRNIGVYKNILTKLDEGLFYLFDKAEKINRGAAYYGAKAKALSQNMSEQQAIEYAKGIVRKTQFVFGSIDTPLALSSDINKTLLQFQSFNIKQGEFLLTKVAQRDIAGLVRYVGATLVMAKILKDAFGMKLDLLPINPRLTPSLQAGQATGQMLFGEEQTREEGKRNLIKVAPAFFPGGVQIRKTVEGLQSYNKGESTTPTGNIRFPVEQTFPNYVKSMLFGQYSTPQAQTYFDSNARPLSANQSELVRGGTKTYSDFMDQQAETKEDLKARQTVGLTGQPASSGTKLFYVSPSGTVTSVDVSYIPQKPKMVGNYEVDKQALSKYKSALTTQKNKISAAVTAGVIDVSQVKEVLSDLSTSKARLTVKKIPKVKMIALKKFTLKKPKRLAKFKKYKVPKLKTITSIKYPKIKKEL